MCHEISWKQGRVSQNLLNWWLSIWILAADWLIRSPIYILPCDWLKRKRNLGRWLVNIIYFLGHDMPQDFCIFILIAIPVYFNLRYFPDKWFLRSITSIFISYCKRLGGDKIFTWMSMWLNTPVSIIPSRLVAYSDRIIFLDRLIFWTDWIF